ncbi:hypothetical protein ENSA5_68660 [Enhygromyxa salina]|uniref:Uncharacterized protein n=1 Tax=Enhygromyxa salina TaxID=215803 RepID=A0A2S9XAZ4_9BACT|nr:hypothetical protein [Enhygromyxa salina]PRP90025.1 hypothetical protein ENSA5_68660 [Enhygromyxa salina]
MATVVEILLLALPLMVVSLIAGLGLSVVVIAKEGRGRSRMASQVVGLVNLALILPLTLLSWAAETRDVRYMFMFVAAAFALIGYLGLRLPQRFRD